MFAGGYDLILARSGFACTCKLWPYAFVVIWFVVICCGLVWVVCCVYSDLLVFGWLLLRCFVAVLLLDFAV